MREVLILGALPQTVEKRRLYESLTKFLCNYTEEVSSPIDTLEFRGSGKEKYKRAFQKVRSADLIISEQSEPSIGQGMEIREAEIQNKPIVVIAKNRSTICGLIPSSPAVKKIIFYNSLKDLESTLSDVFLEFGYFPIN